MKIALTTLFIGYLIVALTTVAATAAVMPGKDARHFDLHAYKHQQNVAANAPLLDDRTVTLPRRIHLHPEVARQIAAARADTHLGSSTRYIVPGTSNPGM